MAPIPTVYDGIEYRSRLEARWAAFMSNIGWEFQYEPFDGDGYIPDFIIMGNKPLFIEVKPAVTLSEFQQPVGKIERGLADYRHDVLIVGADPIPNFHSTGWGGDHPSAGWLAERWGVYEQDDGAAWEWDIGAWMLCNDCNRVGVFHTALSYAGRPCGCWKGDHHLGLLPSWLIKSMWADACNAVKWRGRAA